MKTVGRSVPRTDGADKVTGRAIYIDDLSFPDMLYGATVRSTDPHARLEGVDWDPTFDWSDIVRVGPEDIPGHNVIYLMVEDQPALADSLIRHAEEPVVLIAAEDRSRLREAKKHVALRTEPLPPIYDLEESRRAQAPIYGEDNVFERIIIQKGDAQKALEQAERVIQGEYRVGYQEQMYIEPQGVIAVPHEDGGVTVYGSLQCPYYVVKALSPLLGVPRHKIRVVQTVTGGGFGGKEEYPSMIAGHAALLALKAGRPVKIVYDRAEDIAATTKRHPAIVRHRTAVDDEGNLQAMQIEILLDGGAYCTLTPVVLSRSAIHASGPYRCPNVEITAVALATHTPPNGAFRGFGAPQVCFAVERHLDRIARAVGLTPLEVRRRNLLRRGDTTATGQVLDDSVAAHATLEQALERSSYLERWAAYQDQPNGARVRRGIGLSCTLHGAGFTGNGEVWLAGKLAVEATDSGGVRILTASTDIGQGTRTVFPQIAAETLGVDIERIEMATPDTQRVPDSGPTVASRTCMVVGKLVEDGCLALIDKLRAATAAHLGVDPVGLDYRDGAFHFDDGTGARSIELAEAIRRERETGRELRVQVEYQDRDRLEWDGDRYLGDAYPCYAWSTVVTEVEVDMDTYVPRIVHFTSAADVGKAINPILVEGQIEGGSLQGLGYASMEEVRMANGRYLNHRMTDCIIPTALDAPEMDVVLLEFPYRHGPHGAKGIGEMPMDLPAPSMVAAMEQATGAEIEALPCTPERLAELLGQTGEE